MALTTGDKKWLEGKFVTKTELKKELSKYATKGDLTANGARLGIEFDKKIDELKDEMTEKHDEVMTTLDAIMKEVVAGREHDLVVDHQQSVQNRRLDKLEMM